MMPKLNLSTFFSLCHLTVKSYSSLTSRNLRRPSAYVRFPLPRGRVGDGPIWIVYLTYIHIQNYAGNGWRFAVPLLWLCEKPEFPVSFVANELESLYFVTTVKNGQSCWTFSFLACLCVGTINSEGETSVYKSKCLYYLVELQFGEPGKSGLWESRSAE